MEDKAKLIFEQARRFRNAGAILGNKLSETSDPGLYMAPFIVNSSFAIELYLKCIYVIETKEEPKYVHKLEQLFDNLSDFSQFITSDIFSRLNEQEGSYHALKDKVPDFDWSLRGVLESASQAFVKWRYSFDGDITSFPSAGAVINALEACIFVLREDLNDIPQEIY
ncbi:hypothetical protein RSA11_04275 [Exiguobacterium indicum]|uniref:HEPN domain-containing protein n=1 Tax=Exiguobacterium indicum TaxID=296995 RepID=A0AAW3MGF8_9BACL|nr:hypothetical protein [Exiguobacterium indicum]KTR27887.1 hypothetical protein RSA11_04275 [Exiguobacterium indicum]